MKLKISEAAGWFFTKNTLKNMSEPTEQAQETPQQPEAAEISPLDVLTAQVAELQAQLANAKEAQLRIAAEAENTRRRIERDAQSSAKYGAEKLVGELIAIADTLEFGLQAAAAPGVEVKALAEGMEMTYKQLMAVLEKNGVRQENPVGEKLNASAHQAVSTVESAELPPNHVVSVMQKGYKLHERVIRPAMVVVAKTPVEPAP